MIKDAVRLAEKCFAPCAIRLGIVVWHAVLASRDLRIHRLAMRYLPSATKSSAACDCQQVLAGNGAGEWRLLWLTA
jgi:hypothetical protein